MISGRTAFVTGGSGALGPALLELLVAEGFRVRALVRPSSDPTGIPKGVEVVAGDLNDRASLRRAVAGADTVFHLAAKLHTDTHQATAEMRDEFERINVVGTQTLAQVSADAGVQRFVFFSTIAVYGPSAGQDPFTEDSPVVRNSLYTATKLDAEEAARTAPGAVILRVAATYGPRMKANYRRLSTATKRGFCISVGAGLNRRTLVFDADLARAALLAASRAPSGSTYNVTDGRIHTLNEILHAISAAVDRKPLPVRLPTAPTRLVAGWLEDCMWLTGFKSPVTRATIDKLVEDVAVSGKRFEDEFGFHATTPLGLGWRKALA